MTCDAVGYERLIGVCRMIFQTYFVFYISHSDISHDNWCRAAKDSSGLLTFNILDCLQFRSPYVLSFRQSINVLNYGAHDGLAKKKMVLKMKYCLM